MKKILMLTGSYGSGHNSAANTLKEVAQQKYGCEVVTWDFLDFLGKLRGELSQKFYYKLVESVPGFRGKTFDFFDTKRLNEIVGNTNPFLQRKFNKKILDEQPDIIFVTIPFWLPFISKKKLPNTKIGVFITDCINVHSTRYSKNVDNYYVIENETYNEFIKKFNHSKSNITVSFFPINSKYFVNKKVIDNKKIMILLSGLTYNYVSELIREFKNFDNEFLIIKGRSDSLFHTLVEEFSENKKLHFEEFIDIKTQLTKIGIMIGKPGGAITAECVATDTPLIIPNFTPGLEVGNLKLMENFNLGFYEPAPKKAAVLIKYLNRNLLLPQFQTIKKSNSCDIIIKSLIK